MIWLSTHLYFNGDINFFIRQVIVPLVDSLMHRNDIYSYFFVRYWDDRGPHVRLRVCCHDCNSISVRNTIERHFNAFLASYHDSLTLDHSIVENSNNFNGSLSFENYEPEYERYGGDQGLEVAEEHFRHSSQLTFELLQLPTWNYRKAIANALLSQHILLCAFDPDYKKQIAFFANIARGYTFHLLREDRPVAEAEMIEFEKLFAARLAPQFKNILQYLDKVITILNHKHSFEEEYYNTWLLNSIHTSDKLRNLHMSNSLSIKSNSEDVTQETFFGRCFHIISSYIHMHNNRIGVLNQDESYLAYISYSCLKEIYGDKS